MREVLEASGVAWELKRGTRHIKVLIEGRLVQCVSTTANDGPSNRAVMNALCCVRRAVRSAQGQGASARC